MSKFKVGDKIRRKYHDYGGVKVDDIVVVRDVSSYGAVYIEGVPFGFVETNFELVVFSKKDLLDGMMVIQRNGNARYVINNKLFTEAGHDIRHLDQYSDDLFFTNGFPVDNKQHAYDIIKVMDRDGTIVYEREEPKTKKITLELTEEQIKSLKEQGVSVKDEG